MKAEIIIDITPDGKIDMKGSGFKGKSCDEKMKAFEQGLGEVKARTNLPEYHQPATNTAQQKVGQ